VDRRTQTHPACKATGSNYSQISRHFSGLRYPLRQLAMHSFTDNYTINVIVEGTSRSCANPVTSMGGEMAFTPFITFWIKYLAHPIIQPPLN
jgi:hypothetical protein